jgi:hypothetical protein
MLQNSTISLIARWEILYLLFYAAKAFDTRVEILEPNHGFAFIAANSRTYVFAGFCPQIPTPLVEITTGNGMGCRKR